MGNEVTFPSSALASECKHFTETHTLKKTTISAPQPIVWRYYDVGDEHFPTVVCIPGAVETSAVFFQQILFLSTQKLRVIATEIPECSSYSTLLQSFNHLLSFLGVQKLHLVGSGLGGFFLLLFSKRQTSRVKSLLLLNSFGSNKKFRREMHERTLLTIKTIKGLLLDEHSTVEKNTDNETARQLVEYIIHSTDPEILLSRQLLLTRWRKIDHPVMDDRRISLVITTDCPAAITRHAKSLARHYPNAHYYEMKAGGEFPHLSQPNDLNMYLLVHLRRYEQSLYPLLSADDPPCSKESPQLESPTTRTDRAGLFFSSPSQGPSDDNIDEENDGQADSSESR
ncbi:putative maspardin [Blattamonas nauphoetae]|uniref:Maspardin n=1 Tax=Blattamonas nauphoetae TaxID=2049346 RepID=A0ABQ9X1H6_9EUKA|nr:putative maspardin [Blattamonas nauphoetae]